MSSGERAKQPGQYAERNPFDISQRSQTEVASEIAKRMAAWKKARGRGAATSPADATEAPSQPEPKAPHLTAPVLPARMPKPAEKSAATPEPAQPGRVEAQAAPRANAPSGRESRAPFFATFSIQRAMPPAPSLKPSPLTQPTTPSEPAPDLNRAMPAEESPPAATLEADAHEPVAARAEEMPPAAASEATSDAPPPVAAEREHIEAAADAEPAVPAAPAHEPPPPAEEPETVEALRAKARAIKARWMAAHDLDDAEPRIVPRIVGDRKAPARAVTPNEISGRKEPTFDVPVERAKAAGAETESQDWPWTPPAIAAAFDEPSESAAPAATAEGDGAAADRTGPPSSLTIEALESVSGRREPTFDIPTTKKGKGRKASPRSEAPRPIETPTRTEAPHRTETPPQTEAPRPIETPTRTEAPLRTETPARTEAPRRTETPQPTRRIELPNMQTRIEARRLDAMRADPKVAEHRPVFPNIEPEAWEFLPPIPTSAQGGRHKTTWAIGLGAVILLIGLTAPAAFVRQADEQGQSVAVTIDPAPERAPAPEGQPAQPPAQPSGQAKNEASPAEAQDQASDRTAEPTPPQAREADGPQVADLPKPVVEPSTTDAAPEQDEAPTPDAAPKQQARLGAVQDGGVLEEAPITAPPPPEASQVGPRMNLASREAEPFTFGQPRPMATPMVARPFVPEGKPGQFLRVPTTGTATVPIDGATASAPATLNSPQAPASAPQAAPVGSVPAGGASIGLRPTLIPQLKPQANAAPATHAPAASTATPRKAASRQGQSIFPTPFEQMLNSLADTLGEGKPPNPALRPPPGGKE